MVNSCSFWNLRIDKKTTLNKPRRELGSAILGNIAQSVEQLAVNQCVLGSIPSISVYAVCPGGEEAVLKTVGCYRLSGSNPVCSVREPY